MLARSKRACDTIAGAKIRPLGMVARYNTEANVSNGGRVRPQVERAIRIKSQNKRQEQRRDSNEDSSRLVGSRQRERPQYDLNDQERRSHRSSNSKQLFKSGNEDNKVGNRHREPPAKMTTRAYPSSGSNQSSDQSNVHQGIREVRFQAARELNIIIKEGKGREQDAFNEGLQIFNSLSGFAKREVRIYTAIIRLALRAGHFQWALKEFNDMKKNGVAPDALTYRSIFEGMMILGESFSKESKVVQRVHEIFEEFVSIWKGVHLIPSQKLHRDQDKEYEERTRETSTARSYATSKASMEQDLLESPAAFDMACLFYFAFLFSVKAYNQANVLLETVNELASPSSRHTTSKLPFLLSSRYLFELLKVDIDAQDDRRDTVLKGFKTIMTALQEDRNVFVDYSYPSSSAKQVIDPYLQRREMDRILHIALSVLVKYDVPDRHNIITQSLQNLYSTPHVASLPPITIEKTLRVAMENITADPALCIGIFESALDYNDDVAYRSNDRDLSRTQVTVNHKDVMACWIKAWFVATQELKDLKKAMSLVIRALTMRNFRSSSRLRPPSMAQPYVYSYLMRLCQEKQDWDTAVQVWSLYSEEIQGDDHLLDIPSLHHLIGSFLTLAYKLEKDAISQQDKSISYTRTALKMLEDKIDLNNPALFAGIEEIFKKKIIATVAPVGKKEKLEYDFCVGYVRAIRLACKMALDTGEQGVNLTDKHLVVKWKDLRKKATQLRDLGRGFNLDEAEADWLRSGVRGKSSLALSDSDMRELLG